jgi:hypothetical protein
VDIINEKGTKSAHLTQRRASKIKTDAHDFVAWVIRRMINEFHTTEGKYPVLKSLLAVLKIGINFIGFFRK